MRPVYQIGAPPRTPEELDAMLEDAFIVGDLGALMALFEVQALLVWGTEASEVRGTRNIERAISSVWGECRYVAGTGRVLQVGDLAVCGDPIGRVLRRGPNGAWKVAIAVMGNGNDEESNCD